MAERSAEVVPVAATVLAPQDHLVDAESRRQVEAEAADDAAGTERWGPKRFAQMVEVLVSGTVERDPRTVAASYVGQQPEIVRDSVAAEAERYARQVEGQIAFATATGKPVPVGIVSGRFAAREEAVDSAGSSVAGSEDATTAVAVAALY